MATALNARFRSAFRVVEATISDGSSSSRSFRDDIYGQVSRGALSPAEARDLDELYTLRNSLVHYGIDGQDAPEVVPAAVRRMEQLRNKVTSSAPTIAGLLGPVESARPDTSVSAAAVVMAKRDYSCLPICDGDTYCGTIDADMVLHWVGDSLVAEEMLLDCTVADIREVATRIPLSGSVAPTPCNETWRGSSLGRSAIRCLWWRCSSRPTVIPVVTWASSRPGMYLLSFGEAEFSRRVKRAAGAGPASRWSRTSGRRARQLGRVGRRSGRSRRAA